MNGSPPIFELLPPSLLQERKWLFQTVVKVAVQAVHNAAPSILPKSGGGGGGAIAPLPPSITPL